MKNNNLTELIYERFNEFQFENQFSKPMNDESFDFGLVGLFLEDLNRQKIGKENDLNNIYDFDKVVKKIFDFVNEIFDEKSDFEIDIENLIYTEFFEVVITLENGYELSEKYMNRNLYQYFIQEFPYEKHKNDWYIENDLDFDDVL